jgi:subtilisin family serine protease
VPAPINDPALLEEIGSGTGDDDLAVIVRLPDPDAVPRGVHLVTRFADIATVRIPRSRLLELAESVTAIEAPRNLRPSFEEEDEEDEAEPDGDREQSGTPADYSRRPDGVQGTGRGCVVAALDWGVDVAHPCFKRPDGTTRIVALWDQRGDEPPQPGNRWGYGRIFTGADIDRALATGHPYQALAYDPADAAQRGGAHGTHVLDIAGGSGEGGGMPGVAPEADLVFVHLARTTEVLSPGNLGDSASVLEALDFVFSTAGDRPCVVNMSVGAHGGPHDGTTLVELGIDRAVSLASGRVVVNSAGNYRVKRAHTTGRVPAEGERLVRFEVPASDPSESELEVFYGHIDQFSVEVIGPSGNVMARVEPGENLPIMDQTRAVGRIHHVKRYGLSGDHHVDVILHPDPPGGVWALKLIGDHVHDGRYHAWIERDRGLQPKFIHDEVVLSSTTGTLCNGRLSITCGCANPHREPLSLASFSSGGPTRDGRIKPELVAPGYRIRAARSTPRGEEPGARYTTKSGTSMAAPHVAGTIALMFEAAGGRPLEIQDTRALLFGSVDSSPFFNRPRLEPDLHRFGYGYLDIPAAEQAARTFGSEREREGEQALEEAVMVPAPEPTPIPAEFAETESTEAELVETGSTEAEFSEAEYGDVEYEIVEDSADLPVESEAAGWPEAESQESGWSDSADDGGAAEPAPPARLITGAVGAQSWISGPGELQRLSLEALGLDPEQALLRVSSDSGRMLSRVAAGDLLLRRAPVPGGRYVGIVVSDQAEPWQALASRGILVESAGAGGYVEVLEIPPGGGPPQYVGRQLVTECGTVPRHQQVLRAGAFADDESADLTEDITVDDVAVEMRGLNCEFLQQHTAARSNGSPRTFSAGVVLPIGEWNGNGPDATIDTARVPKLILDPEPATVAGMRRYDVGLAAQRTAVTRARQKLANHLAQHPPPGPGEARWNAERARLEAVVTRKETIYSRMWIRQMMYNRFDVSIAFWTRHYNRALSPATDLDPDIVKSMAYQESRMGTSGQHLMPPPYDWNSGTQHPIRSRFNILQAVDSFGPQQWLMMKEMAPAIWTRHGLDALQARAVWLGMSSSDYASHPTFMTALKEFFQARAGGTNLMGVRSVDLHEDYDFWIRTGIRWLFEKYARLRTRTWRDAVRAYNGGGARAQAYRTRVFARVGGTGPFQAESVLAEGEGTDLSERGTELSSAAVLSWEDLNRIPGSGGKPTLYYVVTGAPRSKAAAGDEGKGIFRLKVRNTNAKYNFQGVVIKWRVVKFDASRVARVIRPWKSFRGADLEDESSRIIPLSLSRDTLVAAYDSEEPLTRLEIEYHWRERFFTSGDPFYNKTGLDFMLMAPIEFLLSRKKRVGPDIPLNDRAKHKDAFWVSLSGVEFTPELKEPVTFQLEVTTSLREEETAEKITAKKTTTTTAVSKSTASTISASLTGEISKGSSLSAKVDIFELGLSEMFKLGGSLGYSRTTTDTTSTSVAKEFAQSLRLSKTYGSTIGTTLRTTVTISRPEVPVPRGTGRKEPKPVPGYGGVGLYLYPVVAFFEVPYVKYADVNRLGQATRRVEGKVVVPFVTGWRITTRKD